MPTDSDKKKFKKMAEDPKFQVAMADKTAIKKPTGLAEPEMHESITRSTREITRHRRSSRARRFLEPHAN